MGFTSLPRIEEYISRGLEHNIVDPDESMVYTKRKLHKLAKASESSSTSTASSSDQPSTSAQRKPIPKFPVEGWDISLAKSPFFSRVEIDKHISQSGKLIGVSSHHSSPTGLMKAKTCLQDEYLHDIKAAYDQRCFYYRAKCFHSFKTNESPHQLKLALCIVSGEVEYAYCGPTCGAGKSGYCNHILALMLKVCKFSSFNCKKVTDLHDEEDENPSTACTSNLQQWHQPRVEGISSQPVMEAAVKKTQLKDKTTEGIQCKLYEARREKESSVAQFLQTVKTIDATFGLVQTCEANNTAEPVLTKFGNSPPGSFGSYQLTFLESNFSVTSSFEPVLYRGESTFIPNYPSFPLDDLNESVVLPVPSNLDDKEKELLEKLNISLMEITKLEKETREQHENEEWFQARKMRFTASKFGRVARRKKNFEKFCSDLINAKPFTSKSTEHGKHYEPIAGREYEKYMNLISHPVQVKRSGFFVSPKLSVLGCSPDGKVIDITTESVEDKFGLLKIKCPSSKFSVTPVDACSDKNFYLELCDNKPKPKEDHEYYDQVQGQMGLTGAKWCDFIVYTKVGMSIERIPFNNSHWKKLSDRLCSVYFTYFLPVAAKLV